MVRSARPRRGVFELDCVDGVLLPSWVSRIVHMVLELRLDTDRSSAASNRFRKPGPDERTNRKPIERTLEDYGTHANLSRITRWSVIRPRCQGFASPR